MRAARAVSERRLAGAIVAVAALTRDEREQMYRLLWAYFSGTTRRHFGADLAEKEAVILLRDPVNGRVQGFSTFMRLADRIEDRDLVAFYSGDTIVSREFWGETSLSRLWGRTVLAEARRIVAERPETRVYWFLICSGYRTWRFLPVFFREYYPHPSGPTPPKVQRVLDALGRRKFGRQYAPETGIVRLDRATPLRPGVSDVTERRRRNPDVAFFTKMNPGHAGGDELACLAELSAANLTPAARRVLAGHEERDR